MAVFWFGWGKKLKNALTKKQADGLYLPKSFEDTINPLNNRISALEQKQSLTKKQADGLYLPKSFEDTINSLNTRISTLEQKQSLTTTVFYEAEADWVNTGQVKFTKPDLTGFGNNFIVVYFKVAGFGYSQVVYLPGFDHNYALQFIGISGYLSDTYPNVNVGFFISYVYKRTNYEFTITAVKSDANLTLNKFKIYSIS